MIARPFRLLSIALLLAPFGSVPADPVKAGKDLPEVPPGFMATLFARDPLVRHPCSMAFDAKGRLFVGMGPQFRMPKPDTPGDSVVIVLDTDGDGVADKVKVFATGFNCIQGLAWHGRDLWVANSPDLTVVRDLDGDDEADEYVRVYTDLGNLEHGLHGLNWAPDGKLYMSKGNSKGLTLPGRIAPRAMRDLMGVQAPPGSPDFPEPITYRKGEYKHAYQDPNDDWGREGGVLCCDDGGKNLEIVARGFRNPWDITFDSGFNWLGTDNDQVGGDRVFMPFFGAHFGWNHPWSSHWSDQPHPPTAPVSGPLFEGSGTGIVFVDSPQLPPSYRGVFFINDWLRKTTFVWRPTWEGALMRPAGGDWEPFAKRGSSLYNPTDIEVGPDGALWVLGWGGGYGADLNKGQFTSQGRIFRIAWNESPSAQWNTPRRSRPLAKWSVAELIEDFAGPLPVWRIDAQDELVRRGAEVKKELLAALRSGKLTQAQETWTAWTLGRIAPEDPEIADFFTRTLDADSPASLNLRIQAVRILAHRVRQFGRVTRLPEVVVALLKNREPRLRFAAVQALVQARQKQAGPDLLTLLAEETDRVTFYAAWQALRELHSQAEMQMLLGDSRGGVRRGALLALLEGHTLKRNEVTQLGKDSDPGVQEVVGLVLGKPSAARTQPRAQQTLIKTPGVSLVKNIKTLSQGRYDLIPGGLEPGARPYTDRDYTLVKIPLVLQGADFLQTANGDDGSRGDAWLTFEALLPIRVHVALDARQTRVPAWLRQGFQISDQQVKADHWTFQLYSRDFPAGPVQLGGNTDDGKGGGKGNYIVLFEPLSLPLPAAPVTIEQVLDLLPRGSSAQGEVLFHHRGGAGCVNCHRLGQRGNVFAPDLSSLGSRATPRHIVESLLAPNVAITEGFKLQLVETTTGTVHSGILLEESGLTLTLGLATGERLILKKEKIETRMSSNISAMPSYASILQPQHLTDITAFLLTQKALVSVSRVVAPVKTDPPARAAAGFAVEQKKDRLTITHSGQPVADFVFTDDRILRPYFANVRVPGGLQVTRHHPPRPGKDATDHDTMHPGIWLGFGDISGADFWRNKGRMEHVGFPEPPAVKDDELRFVQECRLRAGDKTLATLTSRITLAGRPGGWLLVWDATFRAGEVAFTFGDQEEMGFGARVATGFTEKNGGLILNSHGQKTAQATWGKAAAWCDFSGNVDGKPAGITLMPAPANFRESWWHNRDYGVFVANPFGRAAMRQGGKSTVTVAPGESFRLRFGAMLHTSADYDPAAAYRDYLKVLK